jgi:death-on-curing protein
LVWLNAGVLLAVHDAQIAEHGGAAGLRDRSLLDSALALPENLEASARGRAIPELAAAYAISIVRNHPFIDGNRRVGFVAMRLFLDLNGREFRATDADSVLQMLALAAGDLTDEECTAWVVAHAGGGL